MREEENEAWRKRMEEETRQQMEKMREQEKEDMRKEREAMREEFEMMKKVSLLQNNNNQQNDRYSSQKNQAEDKEVLSNTDNQLNQPTHDLLLQPS